MLHIVSTKDPKRFNYCCKALASEDSVIFMGDGIYLLLLEVTKDFYQNNPVKCHALQDDVIAQGLRDRLSPFIELINYQQFVTLTEKYSLNQTW